MRLVNKTSESYTLVMEWSLRELRVFVAAVDSGSFTEAASQLFISQAAVSRTIAGLERGIGTRLLRRVPRGCELTSAGRQILPSARRVLAEAGRFDEFLARKHDLLRIGYAWAALGKHTTPLLRAWRNRGDGSELEFVLQNSPTAGLVEGLCEVAVLRREVDRSRFDSIVVGLERRMVVFASDDPHWARRRQVTMAEIAERTVVIDPRAGTTSGELWRGMGMTPEFIEASGTDNWLDLISAGRGVGSTAEATAYHHPRPGVTYRPVKDGSRVAVRLAWWKDQPPAELPELIQVVTALYETG